MELGEYIKQERLRQGKARKEVAAEAGVSERTVEYWERRERNLTLNNAIKLLEVLGLRVFIVRDYDISDLINRRSLIKNLKQFAPEHCTALVKDLISKEPTALHEMRIKIAGKKERDSNK